MYKRQEHNIRLIGTTAQTIKKAEDRQEFKDTMEKIGEPIAASKVVTTVEDGLAFTNTIGYPVVLRPAYTLGGSLSLIHIWGASCNCCEGTGERYRCQGTSCDTGRVYAGYHV